MLHPCRTSDPPQDGQDGTEAQAGQADPAPAPALGEEVGHLARPAGGAFAAPRGPEPLLAPTLGPSDQSDQSPENLKSELAKSEIEKKSTPAKRGRPKGQPKTGGRKKPGPEPSGREARKYLEQNSGYLDLLCRMLRGKPIKRQGPTGKLVWYHPDFDDQKWALAQVLPRMIPTLASQELTGDKDNPLAFKDAGEPLSAVELARRAAYLLDAGARETNEARRPPPASRSGATAPAAGVVASPSAAAPAPTVPAESSVFSDVYGHISGPRKTLPNGKDEPEPRTEPVPGEVADVGGFAIHCHEGTREGLPPTYQIRGDRGQIHAQAVGGWKGALAWVEKHSPDGADLKVTITKPRPLGGESRPDERAARSMSAPVLHGSYAHRKGN